MTMPTEADREALLAWLRTAAPEPVQGYYLDGEKGQPNPLTLYCEQHAERAAHLLTLRTGVETYADAATMGDDVVYFCPICGACLDPGGLSDHGIDNTVNAEDMTMDVKAYGSEMIVAAESMADSDPRWAEWVTIVQAMRDALPAREPTP